MIVHSVSLPFFPSSTVHSLGPHASKDTHSDADLNHSPGFFFVTIQFSFFYHLDFCFKSSDTHTKSRPGRAERGRREERDIFFCVLFVYKKQNEKNIKDTE